MMPLVHLPVRHGRLSVQPPNLCIHLRGSFLTIALFERKRERNAVPWFNGLLQVHHHDVVATGLQLKNLSGFQRYTACDLAHAHDTLAHRHFVYLRDAGNGGAGCNQSSVGALYR